MKEFSEMHRASEQRSGVSGAEHELNCDDCRFVSVLCEVVCTRQRIVKTGQN